MQIILATFWPGATKGPFGELVSGTWGPSNKWLSNTYIHAYIHMWFDEETGHIVAWGNQGPFGSLFSQIGALGHRAASQSASC